MVTIRPWKSRDIPRLVQLANNPRVAANLLNAFPHPYGRKNAIAFLKWVHSEVPPHILAIEYNGEAVGSIGLHPQQDVFAHNMEMGYFIGEPYWGKGIATSAVKLMVEYGFNTFAVERIFARPFGTNEGSRRVLEKAGFTFEARLEKTIYKNGVYLDELIFAVRRNNYKKD